MSEPGIQTLYRNVLAKAVPDGTYDGKDKVNQAYVWGLTKSDNGRLWWGTGPNIHCLVLQGYLGVEDVVETSSYVCDPEQNFKSPDIFMYDEDTGTQHNLRDEVPAGAETTRLNYTLGIRSAGSAGGVVFFAGPSYGTGVNMFAFDAETSEYLGSQNFPAFGNIRKWLVVGDELYTGVAVTPNDDTYPNGGGMILRWTGAKPATEATAATVSPGVFDFEQVGFIDGEAAELAEHDGKMFISTWPCCETEGGLAGGSRIPAGLWMSPAFGSDGMLTAADFGGWQKVWRTSDYEPDPVNTLVYGGGALASYGGELYWGTMHVPGTAAAAMQAAYGDAVGEDVIIRANRAINIFRGDDFGTPQKEVEVLYGDAEEWTFNPTTESWSMQPTGGKNGTPVGGGMYGASGFGTPFNNYTWTMQVYNGSLFVGTMDYTYLIADMLDEPQGDMAALQEDDSLLPTLENLLRSAPMIKSGADLWRFDEPGAMARPESMEGIGNYLNYGVRTMIADPEVQAHVINGTGPALYIGSANPMNLMTDTEDAYPEGGWELIKLWPGFDEPDPFESQAPVSAATSPATSSSNTWTVSYTKNDEAGGSGVAKVELYAKAPGSATYTKVASDAGAAMDNAFSYTAAGAGSYSFYTIAMDKAGNIEAAPATADAVTVYSPSSPPPAGDTTAPVSKASAPAVSTAATWQVTYTATDNSSGVGKVELFAKLPGATAYVSAGVDTTSLDGKFTFDSGGVEGDYAFYTVATDKSGNIEAAPATPDAVTEYAKPGPVETDLTAPVSKALSPKFARHESFKVRYAAKDEAGGSGVGKVELFVKTPGAASYSKVAVDSADRIDGKFRYTASAGEGVYQFYTVATDVAGNVEKAPAKADTKTVYDKTPAVLKRRMGKGPFVLDLSDHDRLMLRMRTSEQVFATFLIRHEGKLVKQFGPKLVGKGLVTKYWNGTDLDKKLSEPGAYLLVMKARDMAGNTTLLRTHLRIHQ